MTLIRNLTRPVVEVRSTRSGAAVATMRLAPSRPKRDGQDQGADYIDVTTFGATAENCGRHLSKGRKVAVDGRLHHPEWDSDNGHRQKLEVIANHVEFLTPRPAPGPDPTVRSRSRPASAPTRRTSRSNNSDRPGAGPTPRGRPPGAATTNRERSRRP
jgi:single-strand DNA-binding protein